MAPSREKSPHDGVPDAAGASRHDGLLTREPHAATSIAFLIPSRVPAAAQRTSGRHARISPARTVPGPASRNLSNPSASQAFLHRDPAHRGHELPRAQLARLIARADHGSRHVGIDGDAGIGKRVRAERLVECRARLLHERANGMAPTPAAGRTASHLPPSGPPRLSPDPPRSRRRPPARGCCGWRGERRCLPGEGAPRRTFSAEIPRTAAMPGAPEPESRARAAFSMRSPRILTMGKTSSNRMTPASQRRGVLAEAEPRAPLHPYAFFLQGRAGA